MGYRIHSTVIILMYEMENVLVNPLTKMEIGERSKQWLERGCSYMIKTHWEKAYNVFAEQVISGLKGLCITREFPPRVRHRYDLKNASMVWLTNEEVEDEMAVHSLLDLSLLISQFIDRAKEGIVLLDGIEYLIVNYGFEPLMKFLQLTRNRFEQSNCILIAPLEEEALDTKQAKLIQREMKPLEIV